MNDPFEDRLRAVKPGRLPAVLQQRLTDPPAPAAKSSKRIIVRAAFVAAAAAACVVVFFGRNPAAPDESSSVPVFAGSESSRVIDVRPLSVVTDDANRTWKLVEVNWVEEDTVVCAARPVAVQLRDHYRTVVPVAVQFD